LFGNSQKKGWIMFKMNHFPIFTLMLSMSVLASVVNAQQDTGCQDRIRIEKSFWTGTSFYCNEIKLDLSQAGYIISKADSTLSPLVEKAASLYWSSRIQCCSINKSE
jgi:hypothetical protein